MTICHAFAEFNSTGSRVPCYPVEEAEDGPKSVRQVKPSLPPWFDQARFDAARTILGEYFMSIFTCHLSGLVLLVFIKSIYTTLTLSGKSKDLVSIFFRYVHTIMHIKLWYEGEVYNAKDPAYHSLMRVLQMHSSVARIQNKGKTPNDGPVGMSQRDMALTQFAFIGLIVLHPSKMGFSTKREDMERLIYFWRVIGHMLGIEEEYNLCTGDYDTVRQSCEAIYERTFRPRLQNMDPDASQMSEQIMITANQYVWAIRYRVMLAYLFDVTGIARPSLKLGYLETVLYYALKWTLDTLLYYQLTAFLLNSLLRFSFYRLSYKSYVRRIVRTLESMR